MPLRHRIAPATGPQPAPTPRPFAERKATKRRAGHRSASARSNPLRRPLKSFARSINAYGGFGGSARRSRCGILLGRSTCVQRKRLSTYTMRVQTVYVDGRMGNVLNPTRSLTMAKTKMGPKRIISVQVEKTARSVRLDLSESDHERLEQLHPRVLKLRILGFCPEGARQISPGQRTGDRSTIRIHQALKGRNTLRRLLFCLDRLRRTIAGIDRPVGPFQGMGYSHVSVPRALPWADLWLPRRGDRRKRNFKTRERGFNKASSARQAVLERIKADESGGK